MRASAESLHGHQVNRELSLSPTTSCLDEEQCLWSAALSRRGVPLALRSLVHTRRRCSSTVSPCRLVLIGPSVKYRPLTCSERLEYLLHRTSNPLRFQDGRAFSSSDLRAVSLAPPPHWFAQVTAAKLSPRIKIRSPLTSGRSPTSSCMIYAVSTIPTSSSKLFVALHVSRRAALRFSSAESARGKSYLQKVFEFSTESAFCMEACI